MARRTKNAAKEVASLVSTKLCTKFARSLWRFAIHPVPMPPPGKDAGTPNEGNQLMSWGRVRKMIAQNIHFAKFPPINASGTDPCRRLSPDSTRQMTAGGRRKQQHQSHEICNQLWSDHNRFLSNRN